MIIEEHNKHHLPRQINTKLYSVIESLQERRNINTILHAKDVHVEIDAMYVPRQEQDTKDLTTLQTFTSMKVMRITTFFETMQMKDSN